VQLKVSEPKLCVILHIFTAIPHQYHHSKSHKNKEVDFAIQQLRPILLISMFDAQGQLA